MSDKKEWFRKLIELSDAELKAQDLMEEAQLKYELAESKSITHTNSNIAKYIKPGFYKFDGKIIEVDDAAFGMKFIISDEPEYEIL